MKYFGSRLSGLPVASAAIAVGLLAGACGSQSSEQSANTEASLQASAPAESGQTDSGDGSDSESRFPDVDVFNVETGSQINLASELAGGDKAILLWFFAPH